jgi:hypothetical protein
MPSQWKSCAYPSAIIESRIGANMSSGAVFAKKSLFLAFVKNEIISCELDCPAQGRCSYQNKQIMFAAAQF